jgi:RNA polymerase sigma-70 factor (ECF subfamily)
MLEHDKQDHLNGLRRRDHAAFTCVYQRYRLKIYRYCSGLLSGNARANDAVQETFLKLYNAAPLFSHEAALKTWLYTVARNEVRMVWRRDRHQVDDDMATLAAEDSPPRGLTDRNTFTSGGWAPDSGTQRGPDSARV